MESKNYVIMNSENLIFHMNLQTNRLAMNKLEEKISQYQ